MFFYRLAGLINEGDLGIGEVFIFLASFLIAVVFSITLHEVAHAFVAYKCGDDTAKLAGRLTLNPAKHFDAIGFLMMLLVGFGYAKPVPINSYNFKNVKAGRIAVSVAGVVTNLFIGSVSLLFLFLLYKSAPGIESATQMAFFNFGFSLFAYLVTLNFMLALFNFLPIFPLDGFNFVNSLLPQPNNFATFMYKNGRFLLYGLIILDVISDVFLKQFGISLSIFDLFSRWILTVIQSVIG
ncbi:MAG: site-2 protease family protein [Christensenellaceae bacterium]|jgi:Zn-dependent protease|nr:site-2 protease family protein [Christensenellaceae bacterium]